MLSVGLLSRTLRRSLGRSLSCPATTAAFNSGTACAGPDGDDKDAPRRTSRTPPSTLKKQHSPFPTELADFSDFVKVSESPSGNVGATEFLLPDELDALRENIFGKGPAHLHEASVKALGLGPSTQPKSLNETLSTFLPSYARRNKVDLSTTNVLDWQAGQQVAEEEATTTFRQDHGLRGLLVRFMRDVAPLIAEGAVDDDTALLEALASTFSEDATALLYRTQHDPAEVFSWAWIFSSNTTETAVSRYVAWSEDLRKSADTQKPKFVILQLLRAESIGAMALQRLTADVLHDLQLCSESKEYTGWSWTTRVCLVVRLLRHARLNAPIRYEDIAQIIGYLFSDYYAVSRRHLETYELMRLVHIFNRFLSLISLSPSWEPYNSYALQQTAQLALVRTMLDFEQQRLPLTREGYRALVAVQLLHPKTGHERHWADSKSLGWPPWYKAKTGIEQDLQHPGRNSRVIKLIRRMQEAGYALADWDKSAAVLAGWDTDKSPTIQTRALLRRPRNPWHVSLTPDNAVEGPEIWAARIRATRTTREAWASFRSYEKARGVVNKPHYLPYFTMMWKLLAGTVTPASTHATKYQPGDLEESFTVSANPRDMIYVDAEVPAADEFYQSMLVSGVRPGGFLLASLLDDSSNHEAGFRYLADSGLDEVTKDVLRHAEKYPPATIRHSLEKLPLSTLAAFVKFLTKHPQSKAIAFYEFGTAGTSHSHRPISPHDYAIHLLRAAHVSESMVWNGWLAGACHAMAAYALKSSHATSRRMRSSIWKQARSILSLEGSSRLRLKPDLESFQLAARLLLQYSRFESRITLNRLRPIETTFMTAVHGQADLPFLSHEKLALVYIPRFADVELLIFVLVAFHHAPHLLALCQWLNVHASDLQAHWSRAAWSPRPTEEALPPLTQLMCAIRFFFDLPMLPVEWDSSVAPGGELPRLFGPKQDDFTKRAKATCTTIEWPSDNELQRFVEQQAEWIKKVLRFAAKEDDTTLVEGVPRRTHYIL